MPSRQGPGGGRQGLGLARVTVGGFIGCSTHLEREENEAAKYAENTGEKKVARKRALTWQRPIEDGYGDERTVKSNDKQQREENGELPPCVSLRRQHEDCLC